MLGNPIIRISIIFFFSFAFKIALSKKLRDSLTPWCYAYLLTHFNIVSFIFGKTHFIAMVVYWFAAAVILNGSPWKKLCNNKVMMLFLFFWVYMIVASLYSGMFLFGIQYYIGCFVELILVGYAAGMWILETPDGMRRMFKPCAIMFVFAALLYVRYGFATGAISEIGRAAVNEEMLEQGASNNVNAIGLALAPEVAVMVAFAFSTLDDTRPNSRFWKWLNWIMLACSTLLLIRTGSRNACLALFPCMWYVFKGYKSRRGRVAKWGMIILMSLVMGLLVVKSLGNLSSLRAFRFKGDYESYGSGFDLQTMTSGRWLAFVDMIGKMDDVDIVIGRGIEVAKTADGVSVITSDTLSAYVSIFYTTGLVGTFIFLLYCIAMLNYGLRHGNRGRLALLLFAVWAITGLGESKAIGRGHSLHLILGTSLALCSRKFYPYGENFGDYKAPPYWRYPNGLYYSI